jgi:NAD(P)H-dependent FMN reductase
MIEIISGTDRPNSNTAIVARFVESLYKELKVPAQILDLAALNVSDVAGGRYYQGAIGSFKEGVERIERADGVVFIIPEYNGSYPGFLKLFVDYWKYPKTFEHRPFAFIGLGTRWGGLRSVEHMQQVVGYRGGYVFPSRVFLTNIKDVLKEGKVVEPLMLELLKSQARDFDRFIQALKSKALDANSR